MGLREQLKLCYKKDERYNVVIEYMGKAGIQFREASPDHINNCYRIMENGSSIFVRTDSFKLNVCNEDKKKLESIPELKFDILYKNKTTGEQDPVRPYTCIISDEDILEKAIMLMSGATRKVDINVAIPPTAIVEAEDGLVNIICPNCGIDFVKAPRCPECGQLIQYERERWNKPKLENLDAWERASRLSGATAKEVADFARRVIENDGFSYHVGAVDLGIDLRVADIAKPLQVIMLFGKGPCGAFQPKEMIEYLSKNELDGGVANWFMDSMMPYLSEDQKNRPYERLNGYYYVDYSTIVNKQNGLIDVFLELKRKLN